MDCCKKEEDCCPCAGRIECLQAQIDKMNARLSLAMTVLNIVDKRTDKLTD